MITAAVLALATVAVVTVHAMSRVESDGTDSLVMEQSASAEAVTTTEMPVRQVVIAEAVVVPAYHASLSMATSGIVSAVLVQEGDEVAEGQVLLRTRDGHQQAAVAQAEAALAGAQARLAALESGARTPEIAASQANLDAAEARLSRLLEGSRTEDIAAAEDSLTAAQAALQRLYDGPDDQTRIASEAELSNAEATLRQAQAAYDKVAGSESIAMLPQSLQLEQATNQYEAAKARYDALFASPSADVLASARAQVSQAEAHLERLKRPATAAEIAEGEAAVAAAQGQLDLLLAGARQEDLAGAQAAVLEAEAAVRQAKASLADTALRAPSAGTIAALEVKEGEQVVVGKPVAELADLGDWQIETSDLTELDVTSVQEGDRVSLTFDAISDLELSGTVTRIKSIGQEKLGDVTYTLVIRPDVQDRRLRWNMTGVVTIR